jgi:hypothetical protein
MCDIPVVVANEETVVRALRECHVRKGKLRDNVFRPQAGTDEVSVMRHTYMKSDACKTKAQEIASGDPNNPYVGLAAITVESVRSVGSEVTDSREEFCGHAHISHGMVIPVDEPPDPAVSLRIRALNVKARLLIDPAPDTQTWTGEQIEMNLVGPPGPEPGLQA